MTQTLPFETWRQIFEQATNFPIKSHGTHSWPRYPIAKANLATRLALTLVCHQFREIVRPMIYENIHIHSTSMAWRLSAVLDSFFAKHDTAIELGPRVWTKYLIFDINDPDPKSTIHIPIFCILRHCASILGLEWRVHIASNPLRFPVSASNDIPCGLQFFSFGDSSTKKVYLPSEVYRRNADSLRAIEIEHAALVYKFITPLLNVTHLTILFSKFATLIPQHLLPSVTHLRVSDWDDPPTPEFFKPFEDSLVSLHIGDVSCERLGSILGALPKLEILNLPFDIGMEISSSFVHSPRLKELYVRAHETYGKYRLRSSMERSFLTLGSYIREFNPYLFPALASITVSCDFPIYDTPRTRGDLHRACQALAQSLSSPNLRVTVGVVRYKLKTT